MGCVDAMLGKIAFYLGGRAFTLSLIKVGCSGGLALAIGVFVQEILTSSIGNFMMPTGEGTSSPKLPLPASDGSPLPSISIQGDSWIDKAFGDDGEASTSRSRHQPPELPVNQPVQTQTPAPADSGSDSVNRHQYLSDEMEGKAAPAPEVGQASSSQQPQAITGTSSQAAANPEAAPLQLIQPGHQPPIFEGELPPLTQRQEKSLARALNYQAQIQDQVQSIMRGNGRELTPDESRIFRNLLLLNLKSETNLRSLRRLINELEIHRAECSAFKRAKRSFDNEDIF
jgi:hypothetical protein